MQKQRGMGGLVIVGIIALIAVLGGALVYLTGKSKPNTATIPENITVTEAVTSVVISPTSAVSADSSDTGLSKDSASVDTQLKAADQDKANVDAGLNDQQGNLSEQ